jgi:hypothetical protein
MSTVPYVSTVLQLTHCLNPNSIRFVGKPQPQFLQFILYHTPYLLKGKRFLKDFFEKILKKIELTGINPASSLLIL